MNKSDISNLKRQISAGRGAAAEKALHYLQACGCNFSTDSYEVGKHDGRKYVLLADGIPVGSFIYGAVGNRPDSVLAAIWKMSAAGQLWLDEESECGVSGAPGLTRSANAAPLPRSDLCYHPSTRTVQGAIVCNICGETRAP